VLSDKEVINIRKLNVGSTSNVLKHVILGKADAGAVLDSFLLREPSDLSGKIRIIFTTEAISPHPLSAHPRVPAKVRNAVTGAVLAFAGDKNGQEIRAGIQMPEPVRAHADLDYRNLENVDIQGLVQELLVPEQ
jgi:phosphonate transport system substrate-binding protein